MNPRRQETLRLPLSGKEELQVYLSHEDQPGNWAVVYVHGFGSTHLGEKSQALEASCTRRGWTFASFDFRGHGASTGTMLELRGSTLLEDLELLQQYLAERGLRRLGLVGSSMGGWAAAWFTLRHPDAVPACVLIAPAFDFILHRWTNLSENERQDWKRTGRMRLRNAWVDTEIGYGLVEEIDHYPTEQLAAGWPRPLLIFHGMRDDTVPATQSLHFLEKAPFPDIELRLFKRGDHRLLEWKDEMAEAACSFFVRWHAATSSARPSPA